MFTYVEEKSLKNMFSEWLVFLAWHARIWAYFKSYKNL